MPYEEEVLRRAHTSRTRKSGEPGAIPDVRLPVSNSGDDPVRLRQNALFHDNTGQSIIGFAIIGMMQT